MVTSLAAAAAAASEPNLNLRDMNAASSSSSSSYFEKEMLKVVERGKRESKDDLKSGTNERQPFVKKVRHCLTYLLSTTPIYLDSSKASLQVCSTVKLLEKSIVSPHCKRSNVCLCLARYTTAVASPYLKDLNHRPPPPRELRVQDLNIVSHCLHLNFPVQNLQQNDLAYCRSVMWLQPFRCTILHLNYSVYCVLNFTAH